MEKLYQKMAGTKSLNSYFMTFSLIVWSVGQQYLHCLGATLKGRISGPATGSAPKGEALS